MTIQVRARYANGVLTPLEPLDLEEGAEVELKIEAALPQAKPPKFLIDDPDPKAIKRFLEEEDITHYLRVRDSNR